MENSQNIPDPQHCVLGIDTYSDWPDLDRHGLDADPDPEKIMRIRPDPGNLIRNTEIYKPTGAYPGGCTRCTCIPPPPRHVQPPPSPV
jgi:hypothetical protein